MDGPPTKTKTPDRETTRDCTHSHTRRTRPTRAPSGWSRRQRCGERMPGWRGTGPPSDPRRRTSRTGRRPGARRASSRLQGGSTGRRAHSPAAGNVSARRFVIIADECTSRTILAGIKPAPSLCVGDSSLHASTQVARRPRCAFGSVGTSSDSLGSAVASRISTQCEKYTVALLRNAENDHADAEPVRRAPMNCRYHCESPRYVFIQATWIRFSLTNAFYRTRDQRLLRSKHVRTFVNDTIGVRAPSHLVQG